MLSLIFVAKGEDTINAKQLHIGETTDWVLDDLVVVPSITIHREMGRMAEKKKRSKLLTKYDLRVVYSVPRYSKLHLGGSCGTCKQKRAHEPGRRRGEQQRRQSFWLK